MGLTVLSINHPRFRTFASLSLGSLLFLTGCTSTDPQLPVISTEAPEAQESADESAEVKEVREAYEAFDPSLLTGLTEKRNEETSGPQMTFLTQGVIEPNSGIDIPKISEETKKSLLVSYMCRSSKAEPGVRWGVDFSADSELLKSGIQSESCTENSVEMFTTRALSPAESPDTLEVDGDVELVVSIFEIEEAK